MNLHCPQSYEASTELAEIAAVPHQIVTPRHAKPLIGIVQDTLVGSYRLTRPQVDFTRREFMNMMMWNKRFEGAVPKPGRGGSEGKPARWTGHQVLSQLMPPINLEMGNSMYKDNKSNENYVKIKEGQVLQGSFDKDIFSKPSKGVVHVAYRDYGPKDTVNFIDSMQNTVEQFLVYNGFSVGISDLIADDKTRDDMAEVVKKRKAAIENILLQIHLDLFDNNTGKSNQQEFEDKVFAELNKATEESGKIGLSALSDENRLVAMVRAGSKGSTINISQMMACVGQQAPEGKRIPYGFTDRTLPHFKKYDDGAEARGFVESSFIQGLTPQEFFFHAMSGREGLIDTAVKTADTGYIQRQLVKAMEDLTVQYDGSVRDSRMNVVQFKYGEDGINATKIESVSLGLTKLSDAEIRRDYGLEGVDLAPFLLEGALRGEDADALSSFADKVIADRTMLVEGINKSRQDTALHAPVNLERLILNTATQFRLDKSAAGKTDLTPVYVLQGIERLIQKTQSYHKLWAAILRFYLSPHKMIVKERFTRKAFDALCEMIIVRNWQGWAQPGEQVGIIAAQSIGEPSTQMSTLNTSLVHIRDPEGRHYFGPVGVYLDEMLKNGHSKVQDLGGDSVVLDMEQDYYIVSVSQDEKTAWKRISQISRHPANGGLVKVTTKSGRTTTATLSHSFLRRSPKGIVPVLGSDLKIGMRIPIARQVPEIAASATSVKIGDAEVTLDREFGWLCGMYLADGSFNGNNVSISKINPVVEEKMKLIGEKYGWAFTSCVRKGEYGPCKDNKLYSKPLKEFLQKHFATGSYEKTVAGEVYGFPRPFLAGLLTGYFDGDGNVNVERQQIRVGSRSEELIRHINRLFSYCGFFTVLGSETSKNIPGKVMHTLNVLKKDARRFRDELGGFALPEKAAALEGIITYTEREEKHDTKEMYDKIPELGPCIDETGKLLKMPGQSRMYGRWLKKESVGRLTLETYVADFKEQFETLRGTGVLQLAEVTTIEENLATLQSALDADVVWDEIVDLEVLPDPKEYVYDFTVPGNESFMVDDCILVHNTLNTFHLAGVAAKSNVTRGVPRLKELLKVTQNPKAISLTVSLKPEYRDSREKARKVAQDLELTLLKDITVKAAIYYDPDDNTTVLEEDRDLIKFYKAFEQEEEGGTVEQAKIGEKTVAEEDAEAVTGPEEQTWSKLMLRLELDRERMFQKNITMDDIAFVMRQKFGEAINLIYSDYNSQRLIMRIRIPGEKNGDEVVTSAAAMDDFVALKKLQNRILTGIVVRGIPGIKAVTFRQDKDLMEFVEEEGVYKPVTQYILDTDGTNFLAVMNHPYVDGLKLTSSHVHDIYENLGIEATRATLIQEITTLFEEAGVNYRHLGLLCDVMTRNGKLMSVDRYGINKMDIGPLAKASFEETEKILLRAALFGEMDPVTGISANIMMGQTIRGGTGFFSLLLDEAAFMRLQKDSPAGEDEEEEAAVREPTEEQLEAQLYGVEDDICSTTRLQMNVALPQSAVLVEEPDIELNIIDEEEEDEEA